MIPAPGSMAAERLALVALTFDELSDVVALLDSARRNQFDEWSPEARADCARLLERLEVLWEGLADGWPEASNEFRRWEA